MRVSIIFRNYIRLLACEDPAPECTDQQDHREKAFILWFLLKLLNQETFVQNGTKAIDAGEVHVDECCKKVWWWQARSKFGPCSCSKFGFMLLHRVSIGV